MHYSQAHEPDDRMNLALEVMLLLLFGFIVHSEKQAAHSISYLLHSLFRAQMEGLGSQLKKKTQFLI